MYQLDFFKELGLVGAVSIVLAVGLTSIHILSSYFGFSIWCIILFALLSVAMFYTGRSLLKFDNMMLYSNFSLFYGILKMFLAIVILFLYKMSIDPQPDHLYVIPFLIFYFVFVVFETRVLMKLSKPELTP